MTHPFINQHEIVNDEHLIPADEWDKQKHTQITTHKWLGRLLFALAITETLVFGSWVALCPGCTLFNSAFIISLFDYIVLLAVLISFSVIISIFCLIDAATNFLGNHKLILNFIYVLPIISYFVSLIVMLWYDVFIGELNLSQRSHECLMVEGILCCLCTVSGYISRKLLIENNEKSFDISSFHSSTIVIAQE